METCGPPDIRKFVKQVGCFPNALVAYRILLTIIVTFASTDLFFKLKLLKTSMHSTMKQERLNGLTTIEDINEDFISKNVR
jgi:hypothetical protein